MASAVQITFGAIPADIPAIDVADCVTESIAVSGSNQASTAVSTPSRCFARVATNANVAISFGSSPNASSDTVKFLLPAGAVEYFKVPSGVKIACILA